MSETRPYLRWGVVPAILFFIIVWPERGFVPIWDGSVYMQCVVDAAAHGMNVHSLRCGGHQSQLYMGLLALTQLPRAGNLAAIVAMNMVLAIGAFVSFDAILRKLIPGEAWRMERGLLVCAVAVNPLLAATLLQLNSDFGVYVFFAMFLALLVWRRYWLAPIAGFMLCFSKETGVLVCAAALALHGLFRFAEEKGTPFDRAKHVARDLFPPAIPLIAYGIFLAWWGATQDSYAIWNQGIHEHPVAGMHWLDFDDVIFRSYAAIIFVLGFAWIPTTVIVTDAAVGAVRAARRLDDRALIGMDARCAGYVVVLTGVLAYVLTVYRTWSFPRYFVVLAPLLLMAAFISAVRLNTPRAIRRIGLAALVLILVSSSHSSWDPVSRRVFGTLPLGEREAFDVSSIAKDFRVLDADHLCYNLQFTGFHWAFNAMYAAIQPRDSTTIVFPRVNRWGLWAPLDARTFERVARTEGTVIPLYRDEAMIAAMRERMPRELWLVEQPNDGDTLALQKLHRDYADADSARYTAHHLTIGARHLVRRGVPVLPSGTQR